jgi:hypothetical protein
MRVIVMAQALTLLLVLALIFSRWRSGARVWQEHPPLVFAAASALVCWMLVFSPIFWEHYHPYVAPFWGWVAFEATRSRARLVVAVLIGLLSYAPTSIILNQLHLRQLPEPLSSHLLWSTVLMMGLAVVRLARAEVSHER